MHPFALGTDYKRQDLLDFVGSKQAQSGVIWGPLEPGCVICTSGGRHGKKIGYTDERVPDGTWLYFGQGQSGDQSLTNAANARLADGQRSVLLFTTREPTAREVATQGNYQKRFTFGGSFNVSAVETVVPLSGPRKGDSLLRFKLVPANEHAIDPDAPAEDVVAEQGLKTWQERLNKSATAVVAAQLAPTEYRRRSDSLHRYALARSAGVCEACLLPAPFVDKKGRPFLEVHHILRLADDGPDAPANVAAICPNCHRAAHHSLRRDELAQKLAQAIAATEAQILAGE